MADVDGEPDDDSDPIEGGVPVVGPGVRVHIDPDGSGPPTAEERARFNIPEPSAAATSAMAKIAAKKERDLELADRPDPRIAFLTALVAKFPEFDTGWPEATMTKWFTGFERILEAGLK